MAGADAVAGGFVDVDGERYYVIRNVDGMPPFFVSVISSADHWLFVSSSGGLTAGRVSPETALFPYLPVDRIHESNPHTGCKTILRVGLHGRQVLWEPFNREHDGRFATSRNLYKSVLGNKLCFEEVNHDLALAFRYTWATSDRYGFVRLCELQNLGDETLAGRAASMACRTSCPRARRCSSRRIRATSWTRTSGPNSTRVPGWACTRFTPGYRIAPNRLNPCGPMSSTASAWTHPRCCSRRCNSTISGAASPWCRKTGSVASAAPISSRASLVLPRRESQRWQIVADVERTQGQVLDLIRHLADPAAAAQAVARSVDAGSDELARIMAAADGFQSAAEEPVTAHHYANVLFNVLRGGIFHDQYRVPAADFARSVRHFNARVYERHRGLLDGLHETLAVEDLLSAVQQDRRPAAGKALLRVPPDHLRSPSRRSESPMEHVRDQAEGRSRRTVVVL